MDLNNLNQEPTELDIQRTVFADKYSSLIGRQATEEELNALTDDDKEDIEASYQYTQEYAKQEALDQSFAEELRNDSDNLFYKDGELNPDLSFTQENGLGINPEVAYKKAKQYMHDYAKLSSAEQAVVDMHNRQKAIERDSTLLTPTEARALGTEYGVDLKYDKNVARGEVMFAIGKNIYKQELEYQLAKYTEDQDFSALQNLGMVGQAISGGVGFYETAASVALSFFIPAFIATGVQTVRSLKTGVDVVKGVNIAYKTQQAAKIATKSANATKILSGLNKADDAVTAKQTLNMLSKTKDISDTPVLDALSSTSKMTELYNSLSLGKRSALSAADAVAGNIPAMILSGYNSNRNQDETYTAKDCALDTLFAAAIGGVIPSAIEGVQALRRVGPSAFTDMRKHVSNTLNKYKSRKVLYGEINDEIEKSATKAVAELDKVEANLKQPDPIYTQNMTDFGKTHMTEDEFITNFSYVAQKLCKGEIPDIRTLPNKSMILSHINTDIVENIIRGLDDMLPETEMAIQRGTKGALKTITVKGETGLLGRTTVAAFSDKQAQDLLSAIYRVNLGDNSRKTQQAALKVFAQIETHRGVAEELQEILNRSRALIDHNKKHRGTDLVIGVADQEKFNESLMHPLLRLKYGAEYEDIIYSDRLLHQADVMNGQMSNDPFKAERKRLDEMLADVPADLGLVGKWAKVLDSKNNIEVDMFNVSHQQVEELIRDLNASANSLEELLSTGELLKQKYKSPEELIEAINSSTVYNDTDLDQLFGMPRTSMDTVVEKLNDISTQENLLKLEEAEFRAHTVTKDFEEKMGKIFDKMEESFIETNPEKTPSGSLVKENLRLIDGLERLKTEGIEEMSTAIQKYIDSPGFQNFLAMVDDPKYAKKQRTVKTTAVRTVAHMVDTCVKEPLKKVGVKLKDHEIRDLTASMMELIETDKAHYLKPLKDDKIINPDLPKKEMKENMEQGLQKQKLINDTVAPLLSEVQKLIINKQNQYYRSVNVSLGLAEELIKNPYVPGEVILKKVTFTPYSLDSANMNVENLTRNSCAYIRDIENELARKASGTTPTEKLLDGGIDLVEYMHNPANKKSIITTMVYMDKFGSADAAKKAGVPINDHDAMIVQAIRDRQGTLLNNLATVGSLKKRIGSRLNRAKVKRPSRHIPEMAINPTRVKFTNSANKLKALAESNKKYKGLTEKGLDSLRRVYAKLQGDNIEHNRLSWFAFTNLDLDKMFDPHGVSDLSFNEARDNLLSGKLASFVENEDTDAYYAHLNTLKEAVDRIVGDPNRVDKEGNPIPIKGWIESYVYPTETFVDIKNNLSNRYVSDFENDVIFKSPEAEIRALDYLGYDSIADQLSHDFETGQRAYAVLKVLGSEPMRVIEDAINFHRAYVDANRRTIFNTDSKYKAAMISKTAERSLMSNAAMAAGVDMVPSRTSTRILKAVADVLTAPLLANAGLRSVTDYTYQQNWMVLNGFMQSKNLFGWTKGVQSFLQLKQDPELCRLVGYNNFINQDAILRFRTNVDTDSIGSFMGRFKIIDQVKDIIKNDKGTALEKTERVVKAYSNFMINDVGFVDKFTNAHRSSAALTTMKAISSVADKTFDELNTMSNGKLTNLLKRHGISAEDWEFLRQACNLEFTDFLARKGVPNSDKIDRDFQLFIPDNLLDLSDEVFAAEMRSRGFNPNNKVAFDAFRNDLYEKASILINSSADEMTTLPTYRTSNAMTLHVGTETGIGQWLGAIGKFQSFGMACTQMHFGKRIAQYCDTEDSAYIQTIWRTLLGMGNPEAMGKAYGGLAYLLATTAVANYMVDELIDTMKGQRQAWRDKKGRLNHSKWVDPVVNSTGIASSTLDGLVGNLARGGMTTGGFVIQAIPALSVIKRDAVRQFKPLFDDDADAGEKTSRFLAASANILAQKCAISNHAFSSLLWQHVIGGWMEEQEKGSKKYRRGIKSRQRQGYETNKWYSRYQRDPKLFGVID